MPAEEGVVGQATVQEPVQREGGIACPACGAVEKYAGKTNDRRTDNTIVRRKKCNVCNADFETMEVPLGVVVIARRNRTTKTA